MWGTTGPQTAFVAQSTMHDRSLTSAMLLSCEGRQHNSSISLDTATYTEGKNQSVKHKTSPFLCTITVHNHQLFAPTYTLTNCSHPHTHPPTVRTHQLFTPTNCSHPPTVHTHQLFTPTNCSHPPTVYTHIHTHQLSTPTNCSHPPTVYTHIHTHQLFTPTYTPTYTPTNCSYPPIVHTHIHTHLVIIVQDLNILLAELRQSRRIPQGDSNIRRVHST